MKKLVLIAIVLLMLLSHCLKADKIDIVWFYKTDDYDPGYLLNNEKYIWLPTDQHNVIRDAVTGEEVKRFDRKALHNLRIFPYNNTMNYLHMNDGNNKLYYYETENFTIIDSLSKPDNSVFGICVISNSGQYLYEITTEYVDVWDIISKQIVRRMNFKPEGNEFLVEHTISGAVSCDDKYLVLRHSKLYEPSTNPHTWYGTLDYKKYSTLTLDSLGCIKDGSFFRLSNGCEQIAIYRGVNGIDLYDFNTFNLLSTIKPTEDIGNFYFTSDNKYFIAANGVSTNKLQIWDIKKNKSVKDIFGSWRIIANTKDNQFVYASIGNNFYKLKLNIDTSIEDIINEEIKPYPNPTNNKVNFEFNVKRPDVYDLKVVDLNGREVLTKHIGNLNTGLNKCSLEKESLSNGRYNVIIYSPSNTFQYHIIIGE